ncbi:preprotein translocase subunit SecE [Pasteurellaceae bacterium HPA106]|uniref:preprotein translocase subunit SecE n=1 Tax=Spirabiliibacterium pneumoniae TaxID=221400 RepID=UPI001AAD5110|nr:preprotein translocase subunit SecE [Spirabiliibacterium pneumoniae]MBE2897243.1 preprotein translocase subunit SecE [Spirabiliibacterium pneumoniae]
MNSKNTKKQLPDTVHEGKSKGVNTFLWLLAVLAVVVAAVGNAYFAQDLNVAVRVVGVVVLLALALVFAALTNQGQKAITFVRESRVEVRKVVWPTRPEATQTTLIVFGVTVVTSLILWGFDSIIIAVINFLTNLRF